MVLYTGPPTPAQRSTRATSSLAQKRKNGKQAALSGAACAFKAIDNAVGTMGGDETCGGRCTQCPNGNKGIDYDSLPGAVMTAVKQVLFYNPSDHSRFLTINQLLDLVNGTGDISKVKLSHYPDAGVERGHVKRACGSTPTAYKRAHLSAVLQQPSSTDNRKAILTRGKNLEKNSKAKFFRSQLDKLQSAMALEADGHSYTRLEVILVTLWLASEGILSLVASTATPKVNKNESEGGTTVSSTTTAPHTVDADGVDDSAERLRHDRAAPSVPEPDNASGAELDADDEDPTHAVIRFVHT